MRVPRSGHRIATVQALRWRDHPDLFLRGPLMSLVVLTSLWLAAATIPPADASREAEALMERLDAAEELLDEDQGDAAWKVADDILRSHGQPQRGGQGPLHHALCRALSLRAKSYYSRGELTQALADLNTVLAVEPESPWAV